MENKDIIQELNDLESSLSKGIPTNIYMVPNGYFEGFADQVLGIVKADESLGWLASLPKITPYQVPVGYFDVFAEKIMKTVSEHPDYQNSREELESISPFLNNLNKRPVYSVPEGYFENLSVTGKQKKTEARIISITGRKWLRYAAAAVVTGVIVLAGLMVYNNNHKDAAGNTMAKFEKEVKKIDDVKQTENLIDLMNDGLNQEDLASNTKPIKTDDVQRLLKDVSTDELKDFDDQSKDIEDVMMTN